MSDNLFSACLLFVQEQSCGEWGEKIEREDAKKLEEFVRQQIAARLTDITPQEGGR